MNSKLRYLAITAAALLMSCTPQPADLESMVLDTIGAADNIATDTDCEHAEAVLTSYAAELAEQGDFLTAEAKVLSASIYLQGFMDVLHGFGRNMTVLRWEKGEASHD